MLTADKMRVLPDFFNDIADPCARSGLNRNLGLTEADRMENIRRVAEVAGRWPDRASGLYLAVRGRAEHGSGSVCTG